MKNRVFILFVMVFFFYISCFDHSQKKYCITNGKCVTLWKQIGGVALVIPGIYTGEAEPMGSYIKTNSTQYLTFYFSEKIPNKIIVRDQGNLDTVSKYEIINSLSDTDVQFVDFDSSFRLLLYEDGKKKFKDVVDGVEYIDLVIKENYAKDKYGNFIGE